MTVGEIIEAQILNDDIELSYFPASEYNGLEKEYCAVSATTKKYGTFRFKVKKGLGVELIKKRIEDAVNERINKPPFTCKFYGTFIVINE